MGAVLAVLTALVIFGGVHRIGFITSVIVPVMAFGYIGMGLYMAVRTFSQLPAVFALIFQRAFDEYRLLRAVCGQRRGAGHQARVVFQRSRHGFCAQCICIGACVAPGQAGAGAGFERLYRHRWSFVPPRPSHCLFPVWRGQAGVMDGIPFVQAAVKTGMGEWGIHFITVAIFFFAFSSLVGNYYYAESNIRFIRDSQSLAERISVHPALWPSSWGLRRIFPRFWNLADILMGCMAIINIVAILLLGLHRISCAAEL